MSRAARLNGDINLAFQGHEIYVQALTTLQQVRAIKGAYPLYVHMLIRGSRLCGAKSKCMLMRPWRRLVALQCLRYVVTVALGGQTIALTHDFQIFETAGDETAWLSHSAGLNRLIYFRGPQRYRASLDADFLDGFRKASVRNFFV